MTDGPRPEPLGPAGRRRGEPRRCRPRPPRGPGSRDDRAAGRAAPARRPVEWPARSRPRPRTRSSGPPDTIHPVRRWLRTTLSRVVAWVFCRALFRPRLVDRDRLPGTPAIYCFNHLSLDRPLRPDGDAAVPAAADVLRAEGGGHGGRRPQPAHGLDGRDDPVPPGQERPARGDAAGPRRDRRRPRRRDRGGGPDPAVRDAPAAAQRGRGLLRAARAASRSSRSRSAARRGSGSGVASRSGSATRSRPTGGRTARASTR